MKKWNENRWKQQKCFGFCPTQSIQKWGEVRHRYSCNILPIIKIRRLRRRIHALNNRTILHLLNVKKYSSPGAYAPRALRAPRRLVYKIKKHVFQEFGIFTKWKNTFSKLFSCLQNRKARFWRVFLSVQNETTRFRNILYLYNMKKTFSKRVSSVQNEKYVLEAFSISTKWKNTFSKHFPCLQNDKTCFRSILQLYKMKKHVFETFSWLQEEKHVFEAFFSVFHLLKNTNNKFLKRFSCEQIKK